MPSDERKKGEVRYKQVVRDLLRYFLLGDRMLDWGALGIICNGGSYTFLLSVVGHLLLI